MYTNIKKNLHINTFLALCVALVISLITACSQSTDYNQSPSTQSGIIGTVAVTGGTPDNCAVKAELVSDGMTTTVMETTGLGTSSVPVYTTTTNADGNYELTNLPDGTYTITATKSSTLAAVSQLVTLSKAIVNVDIVLTATGTISGTVTLDGTGASSSFVYAEGTSYIAATDSSGNFVISGIPVGSYNIRFYHSGYSEIVQNGIVVTAATDTALGTVDLTATPANHYPVINTIMVSKNEIERNGTVTLFTSAFDQDGDSLTYTWSCPFGTFSSTTGQTVQWTAPDWLGVSFVISLSVTDMTNTTQGQVLVLVRSQPSGIFLSELSLSSDQINFTIGSYGTEPYDHAVISWSDGSTSTSTTLPYYINNYIIPGLSALTNYTVQVQAVDASYTVIDNFIFTVTTTDSGPIEFNLISTANDLDAIRSDLSGNYFLNADIDLNDYTSGEGWVPIGTFEQPYTGNFQGNAKTISNLTINRSEQYQGFFSSIGSASIIHNIVFENVSITASRTSGSIAGYNQGIIDNCTVTGSVTLSDTSAGGIVGSNGVYGIISDCNSNVTVSGSSFCGGIAGVNNNIITGTTASGDVTGEQSIGGLVGSSSGSITQSYATGNITGTSQSIGGLVGSNGGTLSFSYATGIVNGLQICGGLVGSNSGTIDHCYASGTVSTTQSSAGGLSGNNTEGANITYSYATGNVSTGTIWSGGLVGSNYAIISYCFAEGTASGTGTASSIGGLVGGNGQYGYISYSYSTGNASGYNTIGGLVGSSNAGSISYCYAAGTVTASIAGTPTTGGLLGYAYDSLGPVIVTSSYFNSANVNNSYGTPLSLDQMTEDSNFTDWDFGGTWTIDSEIPFINSGYPYLQDNPPVD